MAGSRSRRPIAVGFVAPLSSGEAVVAQPMLEAVERGARLAAARHGVAVGVVPLDDGREPPVAAELVERLAAEPGVVGVVGPKNSGSARAAAPVARAAGLPLLLPAATADDLCELGGGFVFRLCATDRATAAAAAELCARLGVRRLAVRADRTDYGRGLAAAVRTAASGRGVTLVGSLTRADAVFHAMGEVEQAAAIRKARAAGFRGLLLGAEGGPGAALPDLAGPDAEGSYQLYAGAVSGGGAGAARGGRTVYAAEAEDAARALVEAAVAGGGGSAGRSGGRDARRGIREGLLSVRLDGASGRVAFEPGGERREPAVSVWRVRSGQAVPVA